MTEAIKQLNKIGKIKSCQIRMKEAAATSIRGEPPQSQLVISIKCHYD
jgi:hypothetical protein